MNTILTFDVGILIPLEVASLERNSECRTVSTLSGREPINQPSGIASTSSSFQAWLLMWILCRVREVITVGSFLSWVRDLSVCALWHMIVFPFLFPRGVFGIK